MPKSGLPHYTPLFGARAEKIFRIALLQAELEKIFNFPPCAIPMIRVLIWSLKKDNDVIN